MKAMRVGYRLASDAPRAIPRCKQGCEEELSRALLRCIPTPPKTSAALAQPVEHIIRNDGVVGSNPISGTSFLNKNNNLHRNPNFLIGQNNYLL
jgi:hypothetical protein